MMESLPPEMLELIVSQCDHASLKNLRGVNTHLRHASTPGIFRDFHFGLFTSSLQQLASLSKSPLAKHVKTFTFYANVLPNWNESEWERSIDNRPEEDKSDEDSVVQWPPVEGSEDSMSTEHNDKSVQPARHSFSKKQLEDGWLEFRRLRKDQQRWREDNQSIQFKEYFAALPNVVEARALTASLLDDNASQMPVWKCLRSRMLVSPEDWMQHPCDPVLDELAHLSSQAFVCLLEAMGFRASFSGVRHITNLLIDTSNHGPWQKLTGPTPGQDRGDNPSALEYKMRYQMILGAFSRLTDVNLRVYNSEEMSGVTGDDIGKEVDELLRAANGLKHLQLWYRDDPYGRMGFGNLSPAPPFTSLFKIAPPWRQLEYLTLSIDMPHTHILALLRRLSSTLQDLVIRDMEVGDAEELLSQIPKIVKLQNIYLKKIWAEDLDAPMEGHMLFRDSIDVDEPYERSMKAYLLGQQDEFPGLEFDEESDDEDEGIEDHEFINRDDLREDEEGMEEDEYIDGNEYLEEMDLGT